jgi:PRTRC genetic system protein A
MMMTLRMTMNNFVSHHLSSDTVLKQGSLYSYFFAGNGTFISAAKPGLAVAFPIARCTVRGLPDLEPMFKFDFPKISEEVMESLLYHSQVSAQDGLERLFHVLWDEESRVFRLHSPVQHQTAVSCRPIEDDENSTLHQAVIEIHSHHSMRANFSRIDDADETGFRIYGVIGDVLGRPEIRFRVGLHGYFWQIPAAWVCELPSKIEDLNA